MSSNFKSNRFIILIIIFTFFLAFPFSAHATTYYVNAYTGSDNPAYDGISPGKYWQTIHYAINRDEVSGGDVIEVADGLYSENVNVTKPVIIRSQDLINNGENNSAIVSGSPSDHVFEITVSNAVIEGFTIYGATDSDKAGIYINGVDNCTIANNACGSSSGESNYYGIYLDSSSTGNNILNNTCSYNANDGIRLYLATENIILNNTCSLNNDDGIYLFSSSNNIISRNTCNDNGVRGLAFNSSANANTISYNNAADNTVGAMRFMNSSSNNRLYLNFFE